MGENGAGKSTLIKIITGVYQPDEGDIFYEGNTVIFHNPTVANRYQIAAVYQQPASFPHLTVTENIFLGHPIIHPTTKKLMWKEMKEEAKRLLRSLGSDINPSVTMSSLSVAQQQIVEIAKALSVNARILIMDEPTASLTRRETEDLYNIARKLRNDGVSIILISHLFEDVYEIADRVTVLRDGKSIGTWNVNEIDEKDLIKAMVGREISQLFPKNKVSFGKELLRVEGLSRLGYFSDISFSLRAGEIVDLAGWLVREELK